MKYLALGIFIGLSLISVATALIRWQAASELPVVYWVTNANPARVQQVKAFKEWLKKNDYPDFDLRLDSANNELSKKLIQGVSGMGGDIIDVNTADMMPYLAESGIISDLAPFAEEMGFGVKDTYDSMEEALKFRGKQYVYPCNLNVELYNVNRDAFRKVGMEPPPASWDFETFERIGREYIQKANMSGERERYFFCNANNAEGVLRRSYGLDIFNETLTASTLNDPRNAALLEKLRQWTEERIIPSVGDVASFASESGTGEMGAQIFQRGYYAMLLSGRHFITQGRQAGEFDLAVSQPPYEEFPNAQISARAAGIYSGSQHPELARLFLKFLASPEYNQLIVEDGDGVPPVPATAKTEEFLHPVKYPNESDYHGAFAEAARTIAIPYSVSPYVNPYLVKRIDRDYADAFKAGLFDSSESGRRAAEEINAEIQRTLTEHPSLQDAFDQDVKLQKEIELRKASGEKIPARWIKNPFHLKYYEAKGMLE